MIENRVAEGGADRLRELRERVALISPNNAVRSGVVVAETAPSSARNINDIDCQGFWLSLAIPMIIPALCVGMPPRAFRQ